MKKRNDNYFTLTTPRKDGAILEQFLSEFGYLEFEKEENTEDTKRMIKQVSSNTELVAEVADFCKDNKCKIQLIYKRDGQLVQQTFQSDKAYTPKTYGHSSGEKLSAIDENDKKNVEQAIPLNNESSIKTFIRNKERENKNNKNQRNKRNTAPSRTQKTKNNSNNSNNQKPKANKKFKNNQPPRLKEPSSETMTKEPQNISDVKVITKKRRIVI